MGDSGSSSSFMMLWPSGETRNLLSNIFKFFIFSGYVVASIVFISDASSQNNKACYVQSTYRQDFLAKVQSNPFYTSTNIYKAAGPMSPSTNGEKNGHLQSSIAMFPVVHSNKTADSAFIAPSQMPGAASMYQYNAATGKVTASPSGMDAVLSAMLGRNPLSNAPSVLKANFERCIFGMDKEADKDAEMLKFDSTSHRAGTCLLTAQQAVVDISSNYRTSLTLFSSVNLLFIVWVVMWISSSFALFYFGEHTLKWTGGGIKKAVNEFKEASGYNTYNQSGYKKLESGSEQTPTCFSTVWNFIASSDVVIIFCVAWNAVLLIIVFSQYSRDNHIPANNAVLAVLATLFAMAKQTQWANFHASSDNAVTNFSASDPEAAGIQNNSSSPAPLEMPNTLTDPSKSKQSDPSKFGRANSVRSSFNTTSFFSFSKKHSGYYEPLETKTQIRMAKNGKVFVTGKVFADDEYLQNIQVPSPFFPIPAFGNLSNTWNGEQDSLQSSTIQNIEYTITTSILFSSVLAYFSPIVPTGMVQLLFANIICLHVTARACIKLSKMHYRDQEKNVYRWSQSAGILFGFVWHMMFTVSCLWIESTYLMDANYKLMVTMVVFHTIFSVATFFQCFLHLLVSSDEMSAMVEVFFRVAHISINCIFKVVIASMAFAAAKDKNFDAPHCNLWGIE